MSKIMSYFFSSIGRKQLMGVAGLALCGFMFTHALGNYLIFFGPEAYNSYSHSLTSMSIFPIIEMGLLVVFLTHLILAIVVSIYNKKAKGGQYAKTPRGKRGTSLLRSSLFWQGIIVLVFIVGHLVTLRFGEEIHVTYSGLEMDNLFALVGSFLKEPIIMIFYMLSIGVLGFHLAHGLQASLKTFGIYHPETLLNILSWTFSVFVSFSFFAQVIFMFVQFS
ncbi:MAG: hypothetical protein HAW63_03615 [Bdellovibrionaceae bacterium]|nr:hypothetical protein [Pseudobdellovibrionaceae bacterium]